MATRSDAKRLTDALTKLVAAVSDVAAVVADLDADEREPEYVSAASLGIPSRTLRRLIADGELPGVNIARAAHVRRVDWLAYAERQAMLPKAERPPREMPDPSGGTRPKVRSLRSTSSEPANADDDFARLTGAAQ